MSRQRGFSLIEILVAITILAFLMLGVYTLVDNSSLSQVRTVEEDDRLLQMETALARVELDFSHLYSPLFYSVPYTASRQDPGANASNSFEPPQLSSLRTFRATERFPAIAKNGRPIPIITQEDEDTILFMTSVHQRKLANAKQSNFAWVRYTLRTMDPSDVNAEEKINPEANQEWVRQYIADNPYGETFNWNDVPEQIILKHVKKVSLEFYDKQKDKFMSNLKELSGEMPRLMKITLEWSEANNVLSTSVRYVRVLWPEFDTKADDQELMKAYLDIHKRNEENKKASGGQEPSEPPPDNDPEGE